MNEPDPLTCGGEIVRDATLAGDLACGRGPGLVVAADNVTIDLGGHTVSGGAETGARGPGILLRDVSGVTVRNGTVERFDAGVVIEGGSDNVVENLTVQDNVGDPGGELGDGILISDSRANRIRVNTVLRNGPFSGISVGHRSEDNEILDNTVAANAMTDLDHPGGGGQTMGIRIEGPAANRNRIAGNTVTGSGADGIVVLSTCDNPDDEPPCAGTPPNEGNVITGNTVSGNGLSGRGSGIRVFSMPMPVAPVGNTISDNVADDNAWYGIAIDGAPLGSGGNHAMRNRAHGNGRFDGSDGALMPPCGKNEWNDNDFGTANQPCVS